MSIIDTPVPPSPAPEEGENKIIDLRGNELSITTGQEKSYPHCYSSCCRVLVDKHYRTVECKECGRILDPFDYLWGWAKKGDQRMERLAAMDREIRLKHNELEIIKTALAREKAKVRKINPDCPEVITWRRQIENRTA